MNSGHAGGIKCPIRPQCTFRILPKEEWKSEELKKATRSFTYLIATATYKMVSHCNLNYNVIKV